MPPNLKERLVGLLRAFSAIAVIALAWMVWRHGFNDFTVSTDLQLLGLLILAVGLVETGRLVASLSSHPDASTLSRGTRIMLTLAVLFLNALGGFLFLLPIVEPLLT